jgi:transposase
MKEHRQFRLWVGVDIAAETFTVTWGRSSEEPIKPVTLPQTPDGYTQLQQRLHETGVAASEVLVVMEATSSYWITLAVTLHHAGFAVSVVNPTQVHNYAKSLPRRSKTDVLDARLMLQFALERHPAPWTPPPDVYHELRQRLVARDALLEMRQQARNHRHALVQWPVQIATVKEHLDAVIADLDTHIATLEQEISAVLRQGAWAASASLLQTIKSVGPLTTAWLLVLTLNFQACASPAAAVAYAGLAPMLRESGRSVRGRPQIGGGNKRLRTALYLATFNAARFNPVIRDFYERLRAAGKPKKVARCAAARKLLQIAWAVVHSGQAFDPCYGGRVANAA